MVAEWTVSVIWEGFHTTEQNKAKQNETEQQQQQQNPEHRKFKNFKISRDSYEVKKLG